MRGPTEAEQRVLDLVKHFFVPLFRATPSDERPFIGSGTLVHVGERYGVLTAAHVTDVIGADDKISILLGATGEMYEEHRTHLSMVRLRDVQEPEWGPDLAFLTFSDAVLGSEFRSVVDRFGHVFYDVTRVPNAAEDLPSRGLFVISGAPEADARFDGNHRFVVGEGLISAELALHRRGEFDYLDFQDEWSIEQTPAFSWGGVSGGGLWRLFVRDGAVGGGVELSSRPQLIGVAFWEPPDSGAPRSYIRCHGPSSIRKLLAQP